MSTKVLCWSEASANSLGMHQTSLLPRRAARIWSKRLPRVRRLRCDGPRREREKESGRGGGGSESGMGIGRRWEGSSAAGHGVTCSSVADTLTGRLRSSTSVSIAYIFMSCLRDSAKPMPCSEHGSCSCKSCKLTERIVRTELANTALGRSNHQQWPSNGAVLRITIDKDCC